MADDPSSILRAIEKSSDRTEAALSELSGEIRVMCNAITESLSRPHNNGGLYGIIASFVVVIISLGSIGFSAIDSVSDRSDLLAEFQKERASFQEERLQTFTQYVDSILTELDIKLQQEIAAEAALRDRRFADVDADSSNRHNAQQAQIDEIKAWFKAPALRNNNKD